MTPINTAKRYSEQVVKEMQKAFGFSNALAVPKITKVIVNIGVGSIRDEKQLAEIQRVLSLITGQKPVPRKAKRAIASFKTRIGMIIGYSVTLRGKRMHDFLDRLIYIALPRTRDFRGIPLRSIDEGGSLTIGIKEHIVFPELIGEDIKFIFGFEVTITTNAGDRTRAAALFRALGLPMQEERASK